MTKHTNIAADPKRAAAQHAVTLIEPGMVVGLGVGSTAIHAVRQIAALLRNGVLRDIICVPCSKSTHAVAEELGIPLTTLEDHPCVDLTIDGADEVDAAMNLIKGGGGALLREKIVAQASAREVIVCDESKLSTYLGERWALPVEVVPFGHGATRKYLQSLECEAKQRTTNGGEPFFTDQGNFIYDCNFGRIENPAELAALLDPRAGIVEHGLFIGLATDLIVAGADGIRHARRKS